MKTLLFNGCSFMAGDELVWKQYQKEFNKETVPWFNKENQPLSLTDVEFRNEYVEYRKRFNLPAVISRNLGCEKIDLSRDGKSNEMIAVETIAYINTIDKEERKNYHVIIGWSSLSRIMKYSKESKLFVDLTAGHYDKHNEDPAKNALKEHIKVRILGGDDEDFILDYVKHIMLLENYLIANHVSYTFYRGLDDTTFDFKTIGPLGYQSNSKLQIKDCTNHGHWYKFTDNQQTPINGVGWGSEFFCMPHKWVTPLNSHPGIEYVNDFAMRLSNFIKTQNVL